MKSIVISADSNSTLNLLMDIAKKMRLRAKVLTEKEMKWEFMPEDDAELEKILDKAEKNFNKGKFLSAEKAKEIVKKWK